MKVPVFCNGHKVIILGVFYRDFVYKTDFGYYYYVDDFYHQIILFQHNFVSLSDLFNLSPSFKNEFLSC